MSRSYKKTPIIKVAPFHAKWNKRQASKAVRRYRGKIPNGYAFLKKIYDPWDIHDYIIKETLSQAYRREYTYTRHVYRNRSREEIKQIWEKYFRRK